MPVDDPLDWEDSLLYELVHFETLIKLEQTGNLKTERPKTPSKWKDLNAEQRNLQNLK